MRQLLAQLPNRTRTLFQKSNRAGSDLNRQFLGQQRLVPMRDTRLQHAALDGPL